MHGPATDPYLVLGVPSTASERQIHRAYRGLAKQFHPDRWHGADSQTQAEKTVRMREINAAYAELAHRTAPERSGNGQAGTSSPRPPPPPTYGPPPRTGPPQPWTRAKPPPPRPATSGEAEGWFQFPVRPWTPERAGPPPRALCRTCRLAYNRGKASCPFCFDLNPAVRRWSYERTDRIGLYAVVTVAVILFFLIFTMRWWTL